MADALVSRHNEDRRRPRGKYSALHSLADFPPAILQILESSENFYHEWQSSSDMMDDHSHRTRVSRESRRSAEVARYKQQGKDPNQMKPDSFDISPTRISLTMDLQDMDREDLYTNGLLWKGEGSLSSFISDSDTILRLPSRNREYFNQVTITGDIRNVESARAKLRSGQFGKCELSIPLQLPMRENLNLSSIWDWLKEKQIDGTLNYPDVTMNVMMSDAYALEYSACINVAGRGSNEAVVIAAVERLLTLLYEESVVEKVQCFAGLCVPSNQRELVLGPDAKQLVYISQKTSAHLHFPALPSDSEFMKIYIIGNPKSVFKARKYIQGLQPIQLSFDVKDADLTFPIQSTHREYKHYDNVSKVFMRVRPSEFQAATRIPSDPTIHYMCLTTCEYNIREMYNVLRKTLRKHLSHLIPQPQEFVFEISTLLCDHSLHLDIKHRMDPRPFQILNSRGKTRNVLPKANPEFGTYGPAVERGDNQRQDCGSVIGSECSSSVHRTFSRPQTRDFSRGFPAKDYSNGFFRPSQNQRKPFQNGFHHGQGPRFGRGDRRGSFKNGFRYQDRYDGGMHADGVIANSPEDNRSHFNGPSRRNYQNRGDRYQYDGYSGRRTESLLPTPSYGRARLDDHTYGQSGSNEGDASNFNQSLPVNQPHFSSSSRLNQKVYLRHKSPSRSSRNCTDDSIDCVSPSVDTSHDNRRMSPMDLIQMASEESQSRNRTAQDHIENSINMDDSDPQSSRTYADILGNRDMKSSGAESSGRKSYSTACLSSKRIKRETQRQDVDCRANGSDRSTHSIKEKFFVELTNLLRTIECEQYADVLGMNAGDWGSFIRVTDGDLKKIGIDSAISRTRILDLAQTLCSSNSCVSQEYQPGTNSRARQ